MRMKFVSIFVVVFALALGVGSEVARAQDPANYHWEHTSTNFYTNDLLTYHFTGLDTAEDYTWLLQSINEDGSPGFSMGQRRFSGGAVHTITWQGEDFVTPQGLTYHGAARVIDSWGNELSRHYIARANALTRVATDWHGTAGNNGINDRLGIGESINTKDVNAAGWVHPETEPGVVTVQRGDDTLLHYCYNYASLPTTDEYRVYDMDGTLMLTIGIQELWDYNVDDARVTLGDTFEHCAFVVLATSGFLPGNIDIAENNSTWAPTGNHDNPHYGLLPAGAYYYRRTDSAGVWQADGESTFLVAVSGRNEWTVETPPVDRSGGAKQVTFETGTEEIFNDFYDDHELIDSEIGVVDSTNYTFERSREYSFTTGVLLAPHTLDWWIYPSVSGWNTATLSERGFNVSDTYTLSFGFTTQQRIETQLQSVGFGTTLGKGLAMLLAILGAMIFISRKGARSFKAFALVFLIVGGGWIAIGLGDTLTTVLFAVVAIIVLWLTLNSNSTVNTSGDGM